MSPDPPSPSTSTSKPTDPTGPTSPTDGPPTSTSDSPSETCCTSVKFESTGAIGTAKPEYLGSYRKVGTTDGRAVYRKDDIYLHYVNDVAHKFEAWVFSASQNDLIGDIVNEDSNDCVDATAASWELFDVNK